MDKQNFLDIIGDTHGDLDRFFGSGFVGEDRLGRGDAVLVCGDFSFMFQPEDPAFSRYYVEERHRLDALEHKPYDILFVDGNHENFDRLNDLPVEERYGGRVHRLRRNIFHLMRGEIYDILGYRIFAFGGAMSTDRSSRRLGETYWADEIPSSPDYKNAGANLARVGNKVDIVVTHTAPLSIVMQLGGFPDQRERELLGFLDWVYRDISFERWFFGHWHQDIDFGNIRGIMFDTVSLPARVARGRE